MNLSESNKVYAFEPAVSNFYLLLKNITLNNLRSNIRMICPNCDSQTDTFKSKNKNSKRRNYWKEKIINNFKNNSE